MKKIKRILCFGDSNTWGYNAMDESRFDEQTRWTKQLQKHLGENYEIIEEGLPGRTATSDDPIQEGMNAYDYIYPCLKSHSPLDLVIIMLGTNDAKARFNLTSFNIAQGIVRLLKKTITILSETPQHKTKVLVVSPPPIEKEYMNVLGESMGKKSDEKTKELGKHLKELIQDIDVEYLDLKDKVKMSAPDYTHINQKGHTSLSIILYDKIKSFKL